MFNKIQVRIILLFSSLIFVILLGVLLIITRSVGDQIADKVRKDFKKSQATFEVIQRQNYERLVETSLILSDQPLLKETLSLIGLPDSKPEVIHETVLIGISDMASPIKTDLFVVTDRDGVQVASLTNPEAYGDTLTWRETIRRSIGGVDPMLNPDFIDLWAIDPYVYQVVSVPSFVPSATSVLGTLTLGTILGQREADTLKYLSGFDVTFLQDTVIFASTLGRSDQFQLEDILQNHPDWFDIVRSKMASTPVFDVTLSSNRYFSVMAPLGKGENAYYILSAPESQQLAIITAIERLIYLTGAFGLFLAIILSVLVGTTITRPITALSVGVEKVREGNYDISLPVTSKDELGTLTSAFNDMTQGLKERFHLLRYVGSHTKEMIGQAEGTEADFAGRRMDVTVLFSDIRGFTAFSEKTEPEVVIQMLNQYLSVQADLVEKFKGSVDKFVGDEMVAIFMNEGQQQRAVDCARAIMQATRELNRDAGTQIGIGIGVNAGQVVLGNMGSSNRLDYTVIGANVNLGARLCSAAKAQQILITDSVKKGIGEEIPARLLEPMSFKGFSEPIPIYEVLS